MAKKNGESTELTLRILREIRDEGRKTNERLSQANAHLDQTNVRLEQVRDELGRRITESELRTATALTDIADAIRQVRQLLSDRLDLRDRMDRCEQEIDRLKLRVGS